MPGFSIQSTRAGYYYQDLYAILCFLSVYEENNFEIAGFFVDFGYDDERDKSDDVLIQLQQDDETVVTQYYDIKTGDNFREKKTEVMNVVAEFISRRKSLSIFEEDTTYVVVSHDVGTALLNFKNHTDSLNPKIYTTMREQIVKNAVSYFSDGLPEGCYTDEADLHSSLQKINFVANAPPLVVTDGERMASIRQAIEGKIDSIASKLGLENLNYTAFPKSVLVNDMLNIIQASAGSNEDITSSFKTGIANYLARSKATTPEISSGENGGLNQSINAVRQAMKDFETGRPSLSTVPDQNSLEGSTIS